MNVERKGEKWRPWYLKFEKCSTVGSGEWKRDATE